MKTSQYLEMSRCENSYWWFLGKRMFVKSVLKFVTGENRAILDVGSGTGGLTRMLTRWGRVTGMDISETANGLAQSAAYQTVRGNANELPFSAACFDLVTLLDVLYHGGVREDRAVSEAHRVLKNKGRVLVMDCALPYLWSAHDENMGARKRFYLSEVETLLARHGFKVLRSTYVYAFTLPLLMASRLWAQMKKPESEATIRPIPGVINQCLLWMVSAESKLLNFVNFPIGSSVLVVAEKK